MKEIHASGTKSSTFYDDNKNQSNQNRTILLDISGTKSDTPDNEAKLKIL